MSETKAQSIKSRPVRQLQDQLNTNNGMKRDFIDGSVSDVSSDSEEDVQESCRIMVPKHKKARDSSTMLLLELIKQQNLYIRSQKKVFKLQNEIDIEDVKTRYLRLDLNNAQVTAEETKEKVKKVSNTLFYARAENWTLRSCIILCLLLYIYNTFFQSSFS